MMRTILLLCLVAFSLNLRGQCPTELEGQIVDFGPIFNGITLGLSSIEDGLAVGDIEEVAFNWTNDGGIPFAGNQLTITYNEFGNGDGCTVDTQIVRVQVICLEDPSVVILEDSIVFIVFPNVLEENTITIPEFMPCESEIETVCGTGLIIEYSVDGGSTYSLTPPSPPGLGEPSFEMYYRVYWEDLNNPNSISGNFTVFCEICPNVLLNVNDTSSCNTGNPLNLQTIQEDQSPTNSLWAVLETPSGNNPAQLVGTQFDPKGGDTGMYTLGFFNTVPGSDCADTSFLNIEVTEATPSGEGSNGIVCQDSSFVISLDDYLSGDFEEGIWQETSTPPSTNNAFNSPNRTFDPTGQATGLYTFSHILSSDCGLDTAFVEINVLEEAEGILKPLPLSVCIGNLGGTTTINFNDLVINDTLSGTWTDLDNAGVNLTNLNLVDFIGVAPGSYAFSFLTGDSCPAITNITVQDCSVEILVPNAFTPNNDGLNDRFQITNSASLTGQPIKMQIYNRWGQMVFRTTDPTIGWDGTYQNEAQDLGIYMYFIELGGNVIAQGAVTLIR